MLILFLFLSLLRAPSDPLAVVSHLLSLSSSPSQLPLLIRAAESSRIPLDSLLSFAPNIQYTPNTNSSTESTFRSSLTTLLLDNGVRPSPLDAVDYLSAHSPPPRQTSVRPKQQQVGSVKIRNVAYNVTLSRDALDGHRRFYLSLTLPRPGMSHKPMKISRILAEVEDTGVYIRGAETVPSKRGGGVGVATLTLFKMIISSTLTKIDVIGTRHIDKPVLAHTLVKAGFVPASTHFPVFITPSEGGCGVIICHENRTYDLRSHFSSVFLRSQNAVIGIRPEEGGGREKWRRTHVFTNYNFDYANESRNDFGSGLTDVKLSAHRVLAFFADVEDAWECI